MCFKCTFETGIIIYDAVLDPVVQAFSTVLTNKRYSQESLELSVS
jgi:hypothetical protein